MKNLVHKNFIILTICMMLSSCGSKLHIQDEGNCKQYTRVIINDFKDKASKKHNDPHIIAEGKHFADMIAREMIKKNLFAQVDRNIETDEPALLIDGEITKYQEGNAALRLMIGFGAGNSKLTAKAHLIDNETKKSIANINVQQTSGIIGGYAGSGMDINSNILAAAKSIATRCSKFKQSQ